MQLHYSDMHASVPQAQEVANEALLVGDLEGGAHALMDFVGGAYFGGGDVGHAIWVLKTLTIDSGRS